MQAIKSIYITIFQVITFSPNYSVSLKCQFHNLFKYSFIYIEILFATDLHSDGWMEPIRSTWLSVFAFDFESERHLILHKFRSSNQNKHQQPATSSSSSWSCQWNYCQNHTLDTLSVTSGQRPVRHPNEVCVHIPIAKRFGQILWPKMSGE